MIILSAGCWMPRPQVGLFRSSDMAGPLQDRKARQMAEFMDTQKVRVWTWAMESLVSLADLQERRVAGKSWDKSRALPFRTDAYRSSMHNPSLQLSCPEPRNELAAAFSTFQSTAPTPAYLHCLCPLHFGHVRSLT